MSQEQLRIGSGIAGTHRGQRHLGDSLMKITIIKAASKSAKPQGICPVYIDDFPVSRK